MTVKVGTAEYFNDKALKCLENPVPEAFVCAELGWGEREITL